MGRYLYPVDTDQFADIRKDGKVYVDKTDMVFDLVGKYRYVFRNLPSYTVRKIDFYDKADKRSEYLGRDVTERKLVMDVQLRKEYSRSYVANSIPNYFMLCLGYKINARP